MSIRRALVVLLVAALVGGVMVPASAQQAPPASAPASSPQPGSTSPAPSVVPSISASPTPAVEEQKKPPFWDVVGRVRFAISQWFADLVISAVRPVFDLLGRTVFATPPLADNARITDLWRFSLGIADAALLLFVLAGAGIMMASGDFTSQLAAKELLPRLLVAAGAANVSLLLARQIISASNALSEAMLGAAADPGELSARMAHSLAAAVGNPFLALFALAIVIIAILVLVAYVVRIAAMVILVAGAPLLLVGHALPQTEGVARAWWRAMFALLAAPVLQSMLLAAAFRVFLSGDGVLGFPPGGGLIDLLVIGCLLYLLFKIPFWALATAHSGAGARAVAQAKRAARAAAQVVSAG